MPFQNLRMKIFIKETNIFMTLPLVDTISLKKYHIYSLSKCSSKELYSQQVSLNDTKTESQIYFEKNFLNKETNGNVYTLCHVVWLLKLTYMFLV